MRYPSKQQLIRLNKNTVEVHGGNFVPPNNFLHEEALNYLLEAVDSEMFNAPLYPTVADKAAVYCFNIISNHVFQDGNKRTGMGAAQVFLFLNGFELRTVEKQTPLEGEKSFPTADEQLIYNFTLEVASGKYDLEDVQTWFKKYIQPIE